MFHIFDTLIMTILTYGSDVWGHNKNAHNMLDKVFLCLIRCTLGVKCITSNIIVYGECGRVPPSTKCTINSLCFMDRLMHMGGDSLTKKVYYELENLTQQGFVHGSVHFVKCLMLCSLICTCILLNFVKNVKISCDQNLSKNGQQI